MLNKSKVYMKSLSNGRSEHNGHPVRRKLRTAILGQMSISLLALSILGQNVDVFAVHIEDTKFTLFDPKLVTELKGIVAEIDGNNPERLLIIPDPNYRNLAIEGNRVIPPRFDCHMPTVVPDLPLPTTVNRCFDPHPNFRGWEHAQQNARQCNLPVDLYPEPHPLIKVEKEGYDHIPTAPFEKETPILLGSNRPVQICDHVRVLGYYVLDHGHAMYSNLCIHGEKLYNPVRLTCIPHAELHPYLVSRTTNAIEPVTELQPGDTNIQRLSVFLPFYNRYIEFDDYHNALRIGGRIVDASKIASSNVEWFIKAPPLPANKCSGICELNFFENVIKNQGPVKVEIVKEADGARVRVSASAVSSADYLDPERPGGAEKLKTYRVKNPTIYQADIGVNWIPKQPTLDIEPGTISAHTSTSIIVYAKDKATGNEVSGRIVINNTEVGVTNTPFEYTFNSKDYGSAKVIAPGYSETPLYFSISSPLEVYAEPSTIPIQTENLVTIHALDPVTSQAIDGKVISLEGSGFPPEKEIGDTNTPLSHTFKPVREVIRCSGAIHYSYPEVYVQASGYDTAKVRIDFTGSLPEGEPGDPSLCTEPN